MVPFIFFGKWESNHLWRIIQGKGGVGGEESKSSLKLMFFKGVGNTVNKETKKLTELRVNLSFMSDHECIVI